MSSFLLSLHIMSQFGIQDWAPGIFHIMGLWFSHYLLQAPYSNRHASLAEPALPPQKRISTFSPVLQASVCMKECALLPLCFLLFSILNLIYLVKPRDPKPFSLFRLMRECSPYSFRNDQLAGAYAIVLCAPCVSSLFLLPLSKDHGLHSFDQLLTWHF